MPAVPGAAPPPPPRGRPSAPWPAAAPEHVLERRLEAILRQPSCLATANIIVRPLVDYGLRFRGELHRAGRNEDHFRFEDEVVLPCRDDLVQGVNRIKHLLPDRCRVPFMLYCEGEPIPESFPLQRQGVAEHARNRQDGFIEQKRIDLLSIADLGLRIQPALHLADLSHRAEAAATWRFDCA